MEGVVVRVMREKHFGFIRSKGPVMQEYFFHLDDFNGYFEDLVNDIDMNREVKVTFDVVSSQKGPRAGNVFRVDAGV